MNLTSSIITISIVCLSLLGLVISIAAAIKYAKKYAENIIQENKQRRNKL